MTQAASPGEGVEFTAEPLALSRVDYMQVGVTGPGAMGIIVSKDSSRPAKVVVGDEDGVFTCFGGRKGKVNLAFKTPPGARVASVYVVGERIFVASKTEVKGYTKRGKKFFTIATVMSESIQTMAVHNTSLYLGGDYVYNHYVDGKDADFYLAGDRIRHMAIVSVPERAGDGAASAKVFPVMACADRALRVMDGSNVLHHITTDDSPRCLCAFPGEEAAGEIVYGGSKGGLGCVALTTTTHEALWTIEGGGQAAVSCVDCHDVTDDGVAEILVGRDDGTVQVFRVASRHEPPTCVYSTRLLAAVTSIKGGRVFSADHGEVVCCTYSGQVLGLSTKVREGKAATSTDGAAAAAAMHDEESKALEAEVEALKFTLAREKTALERQSAARTEGAAAAAVLPDINVLDEFVLIAEQASWLLSIQTPGSLDTVVVTSDVDVDLLDIHGSTAVVSETPCPAGTPDRVLATYRCQPGTSRLQLKVRYIEGSTGTIQAYIIPQQQSATPGIAKAAFLRRYQVRPLSLHHRIHEPYDDSRPSSVLMLKGAFSLVDVHSWVSQCLPEVPARLPTNESVTLVFVSTFLGTQLRCSYRVGEATFRSDNPSTISILKDFMTEMGTKNNIALSVSSDVDSESGVATLMRIKPLLDAQHRLEQEASLIGSLRELKMQAPASLLVPEYEDVLARAEAIEAAMREHPTQVERLVALTVDLFVDQHKLAGRDAKQSIPRVAAAMEEYDFEAVLAIFQEVALGQR